MQQNEVRELLRRYAEGSCSQKEKRFLEDMVLRKPIADNWKWSSEEEKLLMGLRIKEAINRKRFDKQRMRPIRARHIGVAASLLLGMGILWYLFNLGASDSTPRHSLVISETVAASSDGIILTLADGTSIYLDSVGSQFTQQIGNVLIRKQQDGGITYEVIEGDGRQMAEVAASQNTLRVPNGKQFRLVLPDGTKVWVNTASSITYPIAFTAHERKVILEGEAYFEVAKDIGRPFKVIAQGTEITVTGTQFNVSAYHSDGKVTTTLLEGGVDVQRGNDHVSLTPGYQAVVPDHSTIEKRESNVEQAMAWKNGYFVFDDMDIVSVLRSVARWYGIRLEVTGNIPKKRFGGSFPIGLELDELLADLETVGKMKFERKDKEVRIMW